VLGQFSLRPRYGGVAELERSLIVERVKAGLRNARAKGKKIGRPHVFVDRAGVTAMRVAGVSWAAIAKQMGLGEGTVYRSFQASAKNHLRDDSARESEHSWYKKSI
jgi:DNA invertase Pin-like site-specific DNA recombinase